MPVLSKFRYSQSGNVAIVFSLAIVPVLLAAGAGLDMIRANQARTVLQAAADAAALAAGSSDRTTSAELEKIAEDYVFANGLETALDSIDQVKALNLGATGAFRVTLKG